MNERTQHPKYWPCYNWRLVDRSKAPPINFTQTKPPWRTLTASPSSLPTTIMNSVARKMARRFKVEAAASAKRAYQVLRYRSSCPKTIGLIVGKQRSGTGMLNKAFDNDWRCKVFGEDGGLALGRSAGFRRRWRWKPYEEVFRILSGQHALLLIAKPLVESQYAERILEAMPSAKFIWAYRHYQDVALSCREQFEPNIAKLNLITILDRRPDWFAENVTDEIRDLVSSYYSEDRSTADLWCLCWYVRNSLILRYRHLPGTTVYYDHLVQNPFQEMRRLYAFLNFPYPGDHIVKHIHTKSVQRGKDLEISEDIRRVCDSLLKGIANIGTNEEYAISGSMKEAF